MKQQDLLKQLIIRVIREDGKIRYDVYSSVNNGEIRYKSASKNKLVTLFHEFIANEKI